MRRAALLPLLALLLAGGAGAAPTTRGGLRGIVVRGPTAPLCIVEKPCTEPAVGAVLVFSRRGRVAGRARVGRAGRYRIALPAGTYAVRARGGRAIEPSTVRVRAGRVREVDFSIDTGIR